MARAARAADSAIRTSLDRVRARCDVGARREADPVGFVHAFREPLDQEVVALVAAGIAFGNVKAIRAKLADALARLGPSPARAGDDPIDAERRMHGWVHRVFRGVDIARLVVGARALQRRCGSLGRFFEDELARGASMREALAAFCDAIRDAGGLHAEKTRRGPAHLLSNARGASSNKRMFLFLRWMIRPADGIDLGLWAPGGACVARGIDAASLLIPVDVHIHKLSRNLGLTRRRDLSWKTAEEITAALARFDARDPVKYDFALCHLGMVQRCPSRRDAARCEGCGVKPVCRHWQIRPLGAPRPARAARACGQPGATVEPRPPFKGAHKVEKFR